MRYLRETEKGNGTNYTGKVNALMLILQTRFRVLTAFLLRFRSAKKGEEKEKEEKRNIEKRAYFRTRSIHIRISLLTLPHF